MQASKVSGRPMARNGKPARAFSVQSAATRFVGGDSSVAARQSFYFESHRPKTDFCEGLFV
jgi:hypothetical protein